MRILLTLILFTLHFITWSKDEKVVQTSFQEALTAYENKDYKSAINLFQQDWEEESNSASLYNLAQCHLALNHKTEALYFFEYTLKFEPNNADAIYNASHLFSELNEGSYWQHPYSWMGRFIFKFSANQWSGFTLFFALILALSVFLLLSPKRNGLKRMGQFGALFGLLFFALGFLAAHNSYKHFTEKEFVYLPKTDVQAYLSPGKNPTEAEFEVNQRYKIKKSHDGYIQLHMKSGESLWIDQKEGLSY